MAHQLFENQLDDVNRRLKIAKTGVTLIQKGNSLYARGTFPPKPGSKKPEPHQQEIALKVKAVPAGLKEAEAKAKEISSALVLKKFDWSTYSARPLKTPDQRTVTEWIVALEQDYFERRKRTPESECTWRSHYREYLRRLPQTQSLTLNLLDRAVRQTEPDSCTRAAMSLTCGTLGKFAGFDVTGIKALKGRYSSLKPARRDLPTDEMIVQAICQIPNPEWRWSAGMMATYGVRPHELFHLNVQPLEEGGDMIEVLAGKTGARKVPPLYPEWIEQFNLRHPQMPQVTGKDNQTIGGKVSKAFRRYGVPFKPYDLRHCWAVRSLRFGVEVSLAARRMGHGVDIHTKIYQAWISEDIDRQAYEATINHPNRPQAPMVRMPDEAEESEQQPEDAVAETQHSDPESTMERGAAGTEPSALSSLPEEAAILESEDQTPQPSDDPTLGLKEGEADSEPANGWRDCA